MELPKGVFITMMPRWVATGTSTLSTPMPARPMTRSFLAAASTFSVDLGGGADGQPVIVADDGEQLLLVLAEIGQVVDIDAADLEDLDGGFGQLVGNENTSSGHCGAFPSRRAKAFRGR